MSVPECNEHLRAGYVGRVGYVDEGRPVIVTMNYRVDQDGSIVMASRAGRKLALAFEGATMCLQVDWIDEFHAHGGSVIATGPTEVLDTDEGDAAMDRLHLRPWPGEEAVVKVIRLRPDTVEGRRLR
jgi:nitroimidazol reductase NimA-like FMN-containing flavoprotein (pyridoxamine 5'-phosphate oxidase superfamily)